MTILALVGLVYLAAFFDVKQRRIPNLLVLMGILFGALLQFSYFGVFGIVNALVGLGAGVMLLLPGYLFKATGAGDVKLMAAIGAFLGLYDVFLAALASIAVGGIVALGYAAGSLFNQATVSPWSRYGLMFKTLVITGRPIYIAPAEGEVMGRKFPFAVSIAIGTTLFLFWDSQLLTLAELAK